MKFVANLLTGFVALCHLGFLVLEMFLWDHPIGRKIFSMTPEVSASSAVLAMNQPYQMAARQALIDEGVFPPA